MPKLLNYKLHDYQKDAVRFHIRVPYSINAFQMGLGKTLVAIATSLIRGHTTLVVCPAFLMNNWADEIDKFLPGFQFKTTILNKRMKPNGSDFYLVSYTSFMNSMDVWEEVDFLVCDEVHYLKNLSAQRTKRVHKYVKEYRPERFLGLSGTPIKNSVPEFWSLLKLCHYGGEYGEFDDYSESEWAFCKDFAMKIPNPHIPKGWEWGGMKNPKALRKVVKPVYLRKRTDQVIDLPKQIRKFIRIKDKAKHDAEMEKAWKSYSNQDADPKAFATIKAVNALSKVKVSIELAKEIVAEGGKVVIFTDHVQAAKEISCAVDAYCIHGGINPQARHMYVKMFENDESKVLVGTIGAMSVGVNLTSASHMIINDYPWVPSDLSQAEKRIHRIGQKNTCFYHYIFASEMDQYIYKALIDKKKIVNEVIDG